MISVIVPYYNAEPWIGRCCESLADNAGDFEFIMVNDRSTDKSEKIVKEYAQRDERFKMLDNACGKGPSGARNTGLDNARGEWITFLDADDKMAPGAWQTFNRAIRGAQYDIYQFDHYRYYTAIDKMVIKYKNPAGVYDISNRPILYCFVWNKLYKAELIKDIAFDEDVSYCEDELFNLECIAKARRVFCIEDETVIHCFDNEHSLSKSTTAEQLYLQAEKMMDFIKRQTDPEVKVPVCLSLSEHWQSNKYLDLIGGRKAYGEE